MYFLQSRVALGRQLWQGVEGGIVGIQFEDSGPSSLAFY